MSQSVAEFFDIKNNSQYYKVTELSLLNKYNEKRDNDTTKNNFFNENFIKT